MKLTKSKGGSGSRQLWTGFFAGHVVDVNPTKSDLLERLGVEETDENKEEINYEKESRNGDEMAQVSFWLQADTPEKQLMNQRIYLINKDSVFPTSGKNQYVNQTGASSAAENEKSLPDWFRHWQDKEKNNIGDKAFRQAIQGEAAFYEFLTKWLGRVDFWNMESDTNILINKVKVFKNLDKWLDDEIRPLINAEGEDVVTTPVICLATVSSYEKDGEIKHYQQIHNAYLPANIKDGSPYVPTMSVIKSCIESNSWGSNPTLKKYIEQLQGQYGCKDAYTLTELQKFDPKNHQQATNSTFQVAEESSSSTPIDDTSY